MGVYIKNITKDDLAENGALMWGETDYFYSARGYNSSARPRKPNRQGCADGKVCGRG